MPKTRSLYVAGLVVALIGAALALWKIGPGAVLAGLPVVGGLTQSETFVESRWIPLGGNYWIDPPETFLLLGGALLIAAHKEDKHAVVFGVIAIAWAILGVLGGVA